MGTNARFRKRNKVQAGLLVCLVLLAGLGIWLFLTRPPAGSLVAVTFRNADGSVTPRFDLEVANTDAKRKKGLMFRKVLDPHGGMIFVYPKPSDLDFWMKDTYVSLDILGIDANREVTGIVSNAAILSQAPLTVASKATYAIELVGGSAERNGIRKGSRVEFGNEPPRAE